MSRRDLPESTFERSVLIVAHPDDEILWFGSVVGSVDAIVICFLHDPSNPELSAARLRALAAHPLADRIKCLELTETCSFGLAEWEAPEVSQSGLRIRAATEVAEQYERTASVLKTALTPYVMDAANIFTHNPWGEYGHEEHVMVHRAVAALAEESRATVWYSNYASNWSYKLMRRYLDRTTTKVFRRTVPIAEMARMAEAYRDNHCWTWFDDYTWFDNEYFVRGPLKETAGAGFGWLFPVNLIHLPDRRKHRRKPLLVRYARKLWRRLVGRSSNDV